MSAQSFVRFVNTRAEGAAAEERPETETCRRPSYRQPQLTLVGTVTGMVQSGPYGNRYETYQGVYWSDR